MLDRLEVFPDHVAINPTHFKCGANIQIFPIILYEVCDRASAVRHVAPVDRRPRSRNHAIDLFRVSRDGAHCTPVCAFIVSLNEPKRRCCLLVDPSPNALRPFAAVIILQFLLLPVFAFHRREQFHCSISVTLGQPKDLRGVDDFSQVGLLQSVKALLRYPLA